jgi:hypothetical protein
MFFVSSASIAADYPELREVIERLDGHLVAVGDGGVRADTAADFINADPAEITRLLKEFERRGVVSSHPGYLCPLCDQLLGAIRDGAGLWCDVCARTQSLRGKDLRGCIMYRVCAAALQVQPRIGVTVLGTESTGAPILFIAGDRGGGPRAQLQIPREEKAIHDAVGLGSHRDGFRFAPSIYAASINDLIGCRRHRPAIVHFAGHGEERLMVLVRDRDPLLVMTPLNLSQAETLFASFSSELRLVVFNTCHSLDLAKHLTERGIVRMAIGVDGAISDDSAIQFAITFYRQLADGESVQRAFDLACLSLGEPSRGGRPHLLHAEGVDLSSATFIVPHAA